MTACIVFQNADGSQSRVVPADMTKTIAEIAALVVPVGVAWEVVQTLPPGPAYEWQGGQWVAETAEPPTLTKVQWGVFLDTTGFRAACDAALAALPKTTAPQIAVWAGMKNVIAESESYRMTVALALVAQVRAMNLPGVTLPTDAEVITEWGKAANFTLASLGITT